MSIDQSIGPRRAWGQINGVLGRIVQRYPCGWGKNIPVLLHELVHLLLLCKGALPGSRGHNLLLALRENHKEKKFLVWEIILLHFFVVIKEMAVGGAISGILYNLLAKLIIIERGLDSYTTFRFHKYGCPKNTSQTSRGETSHNTSSVKGLIL